MTRKRQIWIWLSPGNILRFEGLHVEDGVVCGVVIVVEVDAHLWSKKILFHMIQNLIINNHLTRILLSISLSVGVTKKSHLELSGTVFFWVHRDALVHHLPDASFCLKHMDIKKALLENYISSYLLVFFNFEIDIHRYQYRDIREGSLNAKPILNEDLCVQASQLQVVSLCLNASL